MSWAEKALHKARIDKLVKEIENTPQMKQREQRIRDDAIVDAFGCFCLIACDYLQIKHNYKGKGMLHFLKYAMETMEYLKSENEQYFVEMNEVLIDECGIDVLGVMQMHFENWDCEQAV